MKNKGADTSRANRPVSRNVKSARSAIVLAGLLFSLVGTSMLLLAMKGAPLVPDAARSLVATDAGESLDSVLETRAAVQPGRWQYIYVHHTRSGGGDAITLGQDTGGMGDHFLIGNGDGCGDGEIQIGQRWDDQHQAKPARATVANNCISICLVGDFVRSAPTARQLKRVELLVKTLQNRCGIPAENVLAYQQPDSSSGIGRFFPATVFFQNIRR